MQDRRYPPRNFSGAARLTLVLYWLGWLPGVPANIFFLFQVREYQQRTGIVPPGRGCLWVLFWIWGVGGCVCIFGTYAALILLGLTLPPEPAR